MELKETPLIDLVNRLNQIEQEKKNKLDIDYNQIVNKLNTEYDQIIMELWNRIPTLKEDPNLQPKARVK